MMSEGRGDFDILEEGEMEEKILVRGWILDFHREHGKGYHRGSLWTWNEGLAVSKSKRNISMS